MVELLVTIVLVAVFFSAMIPFLVSAQNRNAGDNMRNIALQIARDRVEKIRQLDYDSVSTTYLNANGPPSTPGGMFGTQWIATTGQSQKTFDITYTVTPVPANAAPGQESYKQVTVSVVWEGAPNPQVPVVLQTDVSRQYFGPQLVDLSSPDATTNQDVSTITAAGQVRFIATVASTDLGQLSGTPPGEVDFTVTDMNGNLIASGSQNAQLTPSYPTPGMAGQYQWLWDSSTAGSGYYIFTAHAVSAAGSAGNSWSIMYNVQASGLAAPTNLAVTAGDQSANLSWSAVSGADHYQVWRATSAGTETLLKDNLAATTYLDNTPPLTDGTTYYYRVRAVDGSGNLGAMSLEVSATPTASADTTPPTAPSNLTMTATTNTSISLSWTASVDNPPPASPSGVGVYQIWRSPNGAGTPGGAGWTMVGSVQGAPPLNPPATTYTDNNLSANTTYFYSIIAVDGANNPSTPSPVASFTTTATVPTGSMTVSNTSNGNKTMTVTVYNVTTHLYYQSDGTTSSSPITVSISNKGVGSATWTPLPVGSYTVQATYSSTVKTQSVSVSSGTSTPVSFSF